MAEMSLGAVASEHLAMGAPIYQREAAGPVELFPNPDFVFPAPSSQATPAPSWPSARRPRSHQDLSASAASSVAPRTRASVSALPSFSFNPAAQSQPSPVSTPPHSPTFNDGPSTPSRGTRHRRRGSEFIGGDHNGGSVSLVTPSPAKLDNVPSQRPLHLGPPAGRRHAHRRSGAISCHDLTSILQPKDTNAQIRAGSAPTSPMDLDNTKSFFPSGQRTSAELVTHDFSIDEATGMDTSPQRRPPSRARVGFADRVEYIRPLSTISSETESSMSTIRCHSVTGSFSSVKSTPATSPSPARMARPSLNTTFEDEDQRPQTSQALFGSPVGHQAAFGLDAYVQERPKSEAGLPSKSNSPDSEPKRKSFGWWDSKARRPTSPESLKSTPNSSEQSLSSGPDSPKFSRKSLESDQETVKVKIGAKKPRKVRSWAHSLISRKQKSKKDIPRPATPPAKSMALDDSADESDSSLSQSDVPEQGFEVNFDQDNTVTIINEAARPSPTLILDTHPSGSSHLSDPDVLSPVIDLDAALGPFNTPFGPNGRAGSRQTRPRRSMHSASLTSGAFGLGAQHRRTESAPELLPFETRNAKFTQPSVMPDVFEEEDEELAAQEYEKEESQNEELPSSPIEQDAEHPVSPVDAVSGTGSWPTVSGFGSTRRKKSEGLSIDTGSRPSSMVFDAPDNYSQATSDHRPRSTTVEVVEDHEEVRDSKSSDETITPPPTGGKTGNGQPALRFPVPLPPQHVMTPDTISDASLYSPFFSPSQGSFDTPRLDTATSSLTDGPPFSFGEPGPEVRISCDDVPSLTSSRSTMTYPNQANLPPSLPTSSGGRAPSVYSIRSNETADMTRHKRGSIASLSRLIPTGFGERSKLSIESRTTSQQVMDESKTKIKSRHRLSKLVQFWKSKEERTNKA